MRCNINLTNDEMNRYSRQIRLPEVGKEGQKRIKGSSVVVIGAGALGCPVLQYLAAAGVGTIGIVDNDWVDVTNLHRQVLYTIKDIDKPKPIAAKEKLLLNNPEISIRTHYIKIDKDSALKILRDYDIVVDCSDNFATRYLLNDSCLILNKPLVYGAVDRFSGQMTVLNHKNGPTLRCLYPEPPHLFEVPSCADTGVIGPIAGIIGSMQAIEVIKIILERKDVFSGRLFIIDSLNFTTLIFTYKRNPKYSDIRSLGDYNEICLSGAESIKEIHTSDLKSMIKTNPDMTIIDLREGKDNCDIGFDCISIPYYEINNRISFVLEKNGVVFYCKNGIQSENIINYFQTVHKKKNLYQLIL